MNNYIILNLIISKIQLIYHDLYINIQQEVRIIIFIIFLYDFLLINHDFICSLF